MNILFSCLMLFLLQDTNALTITVSGVKDVKGQLCFAVYQEANGFLKVTQAVDTKIIPVNKQNLQLEWDNLQHQRVAIAVFQDLNNNKILDKNKIGFPVEPFGFSNNPKLWFGPPSFQKCSVDITKTPTIHIQLN